jgi:hypothetical protein
MTTPFHLFGIRHHGPACARSLLHALESLSPDCILIEGPQDAVNILPLAQHEQMQPPVAILVYAEDNSQQASFYPFAEFSPEWQAIRYALGKHIEVRFIDLPCANRFAMQADAPDLLETFADADVEATESKPDPIISDDLYDDPLSCLAEVAGYADGESWWNAMIEEQSHGEMIFDAVAEAMAALRESKPPEADSVKDQENELREAHMRLAMVDAEKAGFKRIAVVCGAWHVPALQQPNRIKADMALLKPLRKVKTQATWVPWTYQRMSRHSGYGAGVNSPQWYAHLWQHTDNAQRNVRWLAKAAQVFRANDIDCSSAHIIEAARLSDALATMRMRSQAGLDELLQAIQTVVCMGENTPLQLVERELIIGHAMGVIPDNAPIVPLQQDLQQQQKTLRMKPEALPKMMTLDLRKPQDLAKSMLLHRLCILGVNWGDLSAQSRQARGTFQENWQLQWQPECVIPLIERSAFGATIAEAASQYWVYQAQTQNQLSALAGMMSTALSANLPQAVSYITTRLADVAAVSSDVLQFLSAIPPLAHIVRYGDVRKTNSSQVAHLVEQMLVRIEVGLVSACASLDDDAAIQIYRELKQLQQALHVLFEANPALQPDWQACLKHLAYLGQTHRMISGYATRCLFDDQVIDATQLADHLQLALSSGQDALQIAHWLEGFLSENATVLTHHDALWQLLDAWLQSLDEAQFMLVLALLRRAFSSFSPTDRFQLGQRAQSGTQRDNVASSNLALDINLQRANYLLPMFKLIMTQQVASCEQNN